MITWDTGVKQDARQRGLILPLKKRFGGHPIPEGRTLFSLGGEQVDVDGNLISGTELDTLLNANLLSQGSQYYSVERKGRIWEANQKFSAQGWGGDARLWERGWQWPHWLRGDFFSKLREHLAAGFKPAMIHADLMCVYETACLGLRDLAAQKVPRGTLLSINLVQRSVRLDNQSYQYSHDPRARVLEDFPGWKEVDSFLYRGGLAHHMQTVVLKKG